MSPPDTPLTPDDSLASATNTFSSTISSFSDIIKSTFGNLSSSISQLTGLFGKFGEKMGFSADSTKKTTEEVGKLESQTKKTSTIADVVAARFFGLSKAVTNLQGAQIPNFSGIGDQFEQGGEAVEKFSRTLVDLLGRATEEKITGLAAEDMKKTVVATVNAIDGFNKLRTNFYAVAASTGQISDVFAQNTMSIETMNEATLKQEDSLIELTETTNKSYPLIRQNFLNLESQLSGASNVMISSLSGTGVQVNGLSAMINLAEGTFRDYGKVVEDVTTVYNAFLNNIGRTDEAMQYVARMSSAVNILGGELKGMNIEYIHDFAMGTASAFNGLSDKVINSIDILGKLEPALQNTGLSAKNSVAIVKDLTNKFAELNVGQKALLSAQSGGPGGLMGAFQIEKQIRSGDIAGVYEKAKQNLLKQFGGRIYTLEDATKSEEGAAQFQRQRQLITSGAFGIQLDEKKATRLLEAFKEGKSAEKEITSGEQSLNNAVGRGNSIQEQSRTSLLNIDSNVQKIQLHVAKRLSESAQKFDKESLSPLLDKFNELKSSNDAVGLTGVATDLFKRLINSKSDSDNSYEKFKSKLNDDELRQIEQIKARLSSGNPEEKKAAQEQVNNLSETLAKTFVLRGVSFEGEKAADATSDNRDKIKEASKQAAAEAKTSAKITASTYTLANATQQTYTKTTAQGQSGQQPQQQVLITIRVDQDGKVVKVESDNGRAAIMDRL